MSDIKTYSVLIAWNDNDDEQGEFGEIVRAANPQEAEAKAREVMRESHIANYCEPGDSEEDIAESCSAYEREDFNGNTIFGGRVIDLHQGAIWRAYELEAALRAILDATDANGLAAAREAGRKVIAELDAL